jgi:DNA-binding MarR family transcriptional regulator
MQEPDQDAHHSLNSELDESLGFLIADTSRAVRRALYLRLAQHGIRGGHWYCLRSLYVQDGITQRELSQKLGIKESSTLEMLRAMESEGLICRSRDTEDRRKVRVYLADRALALRPVLMEILADMRQLLVSNLTNAEEVVLKLLLRQLRQTLEDNSGRYSSTVEVDS